VGGLNAGPVGIDRAGDDVLPGLNEPRRIVSNKLSTNDSVSEKSVSGHHSYLARLGFHTISEKVLQTCHAVRFDLIVWILGFDEREHVVRENVRVRVGSTKKMD
jgi:hypothetical protein